MLFAFGSWNPFRYYRPLIYYLENSIDVLGLDSVVIDSGFNPVALPAEIITSFYRKAALLYHPDKAPQAADDLEKGRQIVVEPYQDDREALPCDRRK
jgi:hypothetical protein